MSTSAAAAAAAASGEEEKREEKGHKELLGRRGAAAGNTPPGRIITHLAHKTIIIISRRRRRITRTLSSGRVRLYTAKLQLIGECDVTSDEKTIHRRHWTDRWTDGRTVQCSYNNNTRVEEELEEVGASRVSLSLAQWPRSGTVVVWWHVTWYYSHCTTTKLPSSPTHPLSTSAAKKLDTFFFLFRLPAAAAGIVSPFLFFFLFLFPNERSPPAMEVGEALNMTAGHLALLPTHPPTYYKWCSNYLLSTVRAPVPYSAEKTQQ